MKSHRLLSGIAWPTIMALVILLLPNNSVHAYLDPGSGSLLIQVLVAGLLGALVTFRVFWTRILGLFKSKSTSDSDDEHTGSGVE